MTHMETYFDQYFAAWDAEDSEDKRVAVRHKGKVLLLTQEELETLYESGEDYTVILRGEDDEIEEYHV